MEARRKRADTWLAAVAALAAVPLLGWLLAGALGLDGNAPSAGPAALLAAVAALVALGALGALLARARNESRAAAARLHALDASLDAAQEAQQALHAELARYRQAQAVAGVGDWTCDLATGQLTWSPEVYRIMQRNPAHGAPTLAEAVGLLEDGSLATADAFVAAQETGEPQAFEAVLRLADDTLRWLEMIVLPARDAAGGVAGMHGTLQDISARKAIELGLAQAKDVAEAASHAKSTFLATMSHEIRTPLNGMLGLLELIDRMAMSDDLRTSLQAVRESGRSLQRIIDDILDFSKVEAGKLEIHLEPTRIGEVVGALHRTYAGSAQSTGLAFTAHVDPSLPPVVLIDALRLRQILGNFVSNAIKFTPAGAVELRATCLDRDGDRALLRFEVEDNGIGVSAQEQEKLFQPFEQAGSVAGRFGGTGLGLAISRRLAELMGGQVSMKSTPGFGTTMEFELWAKTIDLPAQAEAQARGIPLLPPPSPAATGAPATDQGAGDGPRVLVVDDHPINRMVMRRQLEVLGYPCDDVEGGAQALACWGEVRHALVLTDLNMPGMSGFEFCRALREAEGVAGLPRTPVIACSANAIPGVVDECKAAGMDDYIAKPIQLAALSGKLERWLPRDVPAGGEAPAVATQAPDPPPGEGLVRESARLVLADVGPRALAKFREVNDADVAGLLQAVAQDDLPAVAHWAHRIRGACGFIGASDLAGVCGMLEQAGRDQDGPGVAWLMDVFKVELERMYAELDGR